MLLTDIWYKFIAYTTKSCALSTACVVHTKRSGTLGHTSRHANSELEARVKGTMVLAESFLHFVILSFVIFARAHAERIRRAQNTIDVDDTAELRLCIIVSQYK